MNRDLTIKAIEESKIIVICRGLTKDQLINTVEAMANGGIRCAEVTYSAKGNPSDEEVAENIHALVEKFQGRVHIGAGTVLTERQVELTKQAGGEFIISPDTNENVIKKTRELGLVSIPGSFTPTECALANRAGADFVKLFPVGEMKPSYLKAIATPLSHIRFLAVGGVDETNVQEFMKAGAKGVGIATGIVNKKMVQEGDFEGITKLAKNYVSLLQN